MVPIFAELLIAAGIAATASPEDTGDIHRWVLLAEADGTSRPGFSIDDTVRTAARFRLGLRFLSPEEAFVEGGAEAESGLSSCAADAACLAARLRGVRADYALLLVIRRVANEDLIALRVVRAKSGEVLHRAVIQAPIREPTSTAEALSTATTAAFDALRYALGGELVVSARPDNAEVIIGAGTSERSAASGRTLLLPAGSYAVRARLANFEDAATTVAVKPGTTARADLVLAPVAPEDGGDLTGSVWFWIGVGVAATAVGVAVTAAATSTDQCFCAAADPGACASCP